MANSGETIGHYRIGAKLGEGGMGEVWRATDTKLNREVAVKVIPAAVAGDGLRLARFTREAQLLASLNHPNIAAIYGVEDGALVMELVEGATLAEKIAAGPLSFDEAIPIARQMAEALAYAHEKGVVHRDLKPANVKLTPDGAVKILDFGLAKAMATESSSGGAGSDAATTLDSATTLAGTVLGTAAYMAPEQARGQAVDRRADIWAYGVVLYELLTGERPFGGPTVSDTLAAVLKESPDLTRVPEGARRLVEVCLEKDRRRRLQAIADGTLLLETAAPAARPAGRGRGLMMALAAATVLAIAAAGFVYLSFRRAPAALVETTIPAPGPSGFSASNPLGAAPVLSPDGTQLLYDAHDSNGVPYLWLRPLGSMTARKLDGTQGSWAPFWSPDGKSIGFTRGGELMTMSLAGGTPIRVATEPYGQGGSWNSQGVIVFAPQPGSVLERVSASGGKVTPATKLTPGTGEGDVWPWFLPDGRHFLYAEMWDASDTTTIYLGSLGSLTAKVVVAQANSNAIYASGNLLYLEGNALVAQPFDPKRLTTTGPAARVATPVADYGLVGYGAFTASANGNLVYQPGVADAEALSWFDRSGKELSTVATAASMEFLKLSPDGHRLAVNLNGDIWIYDLANGTRTQFTSDGKSGLAVWSPDGKQIVFGSARGSEHPDLYIRPSDGSAQAKVLYADPYAKAPTSWSPDGKFLVYFSNKGPAGFNTYALPMEGERKPRLVGAGRIFSTVSPDGHWVASQGGLLTSFPVAGGVYHLPGDALFPHWSADGRRIYSMFSGGVLMEISVHTHGNAADFGTPEKVFGGLLTLAADPFAVAPGGERILGITAGAGLATAPLRVIQHWPALLTKGAQ